MIGGGCGAKLLATAAAFTVATSTVVRAQTPPVRDTAIIAADTGEFGRIVGIVTDSAGLPIGGARLAVIGTTVSVTTDGRGRYMFTRVPPGLVVLAVRRIGYGFKYFDVDVTPGDPVDGSVVLAKSVRQLDTLKVTATRGFYDKPARLEYTTRYDDFYMRRRMGFARSYTREQIDKMGVSAALDVIARVPFVRVNHSQSGVTITSGGGRCRSIPVFIDGRRSAMGPDILDMMNSIEIEAIELFRGKAGMPPEALDAECALFVWTR